MPERAAPLPVAQAIADVESRIHSLRGSRVMFSFDLARLYGVETKVLLQAVKRNVRRFPPDFAFRLSAEEFATLRSQLVTSSWGGSRYPPYAFTEQGVAMLSGVLHSDRAVAVNIEVMRAFVNLRALLASDQGLAARLSDLERRYDAQFSDVFDAIRELMEPPDDAPKKPIGFVHG